MAPKGSEHREQGGWSSRSTSLVIGGGWIQGTIWGRSWLSTDTLPPEWYLEALIKAAGDELQRLRDRNLCSTERLEQLTTKLRTTVSHSEAA